MNWKEESWRSFVKLQTRLSMSRPIVDLTEWQRQQAERKVGQIVCFERQFPICSSYLKRLNKHFESPSLFVSHSHSCLKDIKVSPHCSFGLCLEGPDFRVTVGWLPFLSFLSGEFEMSLTLSWIYLVSVCHTSIYVSPTCCLCPQGYRYPVLTNKVWKKTLNSGQQC